MARRPDRRRDTGHGRHETRTVKAITVATPGAIRFPHAQQAVRITRTRTTSNGKTSRETAYYTVSLPADQAQPADLQHWARLEWHLENLVHHVRDVTFREDLHQARTGTGPAVLATLRNTSIGYHRTNGRHQHRPRQPPPTRPHHRGDQRLPDNAMTLPVDGPAHPRLGRGRLTAPGFRRVTVSARWIDPRRAAA
ncbi:ISAs1 family transposase [Micromonospora sp. NPDC005087]|uniref:ISAs1 family transposase n=1 Tax=Micromonospora sp. NPDC005087 TaxID=3364225 RepID=UPI0036AC676A